MSSITHDLTQDFDAVRNLALRRATSADELARNLATVYRAIYGFDFERYDPRAVAAAAPEILSQLFDMRTALRDRVPEFSRQSWMTDAVQRHMRDVLRISRYASDMVGEVMIGHRRLAEGEMPRRAFTSPDMNTLASRAFDTGRPIDFRSGDVVMMRGTAHNSAAIARIGDTDSQFSHVGVVYVDDDSNAWMVESLIEEGAILTPMAKSLDHGVGRAVLFRPKEPALAAEASRFIHDHVAHSRRPGGRRILYDFTMRLAPYDRLFCAKLVRLAYDKASRGRVVLPTFHTRFNRNRDFFKRIGVKTLETFAPADMELDPHFHLVAEWQDYRVTSRLRMQDLIMTKFFEWMEQRGYRFREDFIMILIGVFGRLAANLSDGAKDAISSVVPKIPVNMRRRTIATIAMLHRTAEPVLNELQAIEAEHVAATGRPLHPREVFDLLERMRIERGGRVGYLVGPV